MKKIVFQIIVSVLCLSVKAQTVFNIRAEQHGQDIVVLYSLETSYPCEVSLLLSQDNGVTWGSPLKNVSGDVGKSISGGEKQITWKVLEEQEYLVGDKMKFKVIAIDKKSFEPEMVLVEGGSFQMGSERFSAAEKPIHTVKLSSFNIGKYEVTQAQWKAVMGINPSNNFGCDNCPVENISWNDAQNFIRELNKLTGKNYRLPTEAEWEFASKGGIRSKGYIYSGSNDINSVAWFRDNSGGNTHVSGGKEANELGIYDLSGNVWEWCFDWYDGYNSYSQTNPTGSDDSSNLLRVLRGGSFDHSNISCSCAFRDGFGPNGKGEMFGFRLVLPVE